MASKLRHTASPPCPDDKRIGSNDFARFGLFLNPLGVVDRRTDNALFYAASGADVGHHHRPSIEPDRQFEAWKPGFGHLLPEKDHLPLHLVSAVAGPPRFRGKSVRSIIDTPLKIPL